MTLGGPRDSFYVIARREWPDGMLLQGAATIAYSEAEDGDVVMEVRASHGSAIFILPRTLATPLSCAHELIFQGNEALIATG